MTNKIAVITLGCSKNLVDSERLMVMLSDVGYEVVDAATEAFLEADGWKGVVINTCGFIGDAKEESINEILAWCQAKPMAASTRFLSWDVSPSAMLRSFRQKYRR